MRKEIIQEIEIPSGIEANISEDTITIKGTEGENKKTFRIKNIIFEKKGNKIIIGNKNSTKKEKKLTNTITAHINNMIRGVQKKFEYKLKVVFSHFPITVELKGNEAIIKNFLGEKTPRKCVILNGAEVKINKDIITIKSSDREIAGQVAANFETATRIRLRDRRVFQDGIYITDKPERELK